MSNLLPIDLDESNEFNCAAFLGHGLQWRMNELVSNSDLNEHFVYNNCRSKQGAKDTTGQVLDERYYANEYNSLLQYMDTVEGPIIPSRTEITEEALFKMSLREDRALNQGEFSAYDFPFYCKDQASEVAAKLLETPAISTVGLQSVVEEHLEGFGEVFEDKPLDETRKRRLCRHFVKGFCMRGRFCDFHHDPSIFCSDEQKVFLGGLPLHFTPQILKRKLENVGLTVLNEPRILRGFTPEVCLGSVEEANRLIAQRYVVLDNQRIDVRQYRDKDQLRQVLPSVVKRSVFLGGLKENTTPEMIIRDIQKLDVKVVEHPIVKNGYAPRVVLGSVEGAKMLVSLKRVLVNGGIVDVRPYVNFRKRY
jgi:hypothetical protein